MPQFSLHLQHFLDNNMIITAVKSGSLLLGQLFFFGGGGSALVLYCVDTLLSICSSSSRPGFNPRSSHTKNFKEKWYLIPPCLTLSIIKYISRVKWSNPGKGVVPSPTPRCSSYWKGSLQVALNYSRQLYNLCLHLQRFQGRLIFVYCIKKI